MKKLLGCFLALSAFLCAAGAEADYDMDISDFRIRDPYILADDASQKYYTLRSDNGFVLYESEDLKKWRKVGKCFAPAPDFWGKRDFWAPDLVKYGGKYYIFSTFSPAENTHETLIGPQGERACSILVSDKVDGPYKPLVNAPITPKGWICLDATLYVDGDGQPWMLFCREWIQVRDGEMYAQKLSKDLKKTVGKPILLFKASSYRYARDGVCVTDAPVVNRSPDGTLYMTWSTQDNRGGYVIALAVSESGKIEGPWVQLEPLNPKEDGGHAMVFKAFDGRTMISYHAPNSKTETMTIRELKFEDGFPILGEKVR